MLLYVAQINAIPTYTSLTQKGTSLPTKRLIIAARTSGNRQYPNKQMLWKKVIVPPRSCPFTAITPPPNHTIMNTISNSNDLSSASVFELKTLNLNYYYSANDVILTRRESNKIRMDPTNPNFVPLFFSVQYYPDFFQLQVKMD